MHSSRSIRSIGNELSRSFVIAAVVVFILSAAGIAFIQQKYINYKRTTADLELKSTLQVYSSTLLSQAAIVANANEFVQFIRSGPLTRADLDNDIADLMNRLPLEVVGWRIRNGRNELIANSGTVTDNRVTLKLCYLGDALNGDYGSCMGDLDLYLAKDELFQKLQQMNSRIEWCPTCEPIETFPIADKGLNNASSSMQLFISITPEEDSAYIIAAVVITFFAVLVMGIWGRYHIRAVLQREVINPILGVSAVVENADIAASSIDEIVELRYQKNLLQAKTLAGEEQSRKLANEIHDIFGPTLVALKWELSRLAKKVNQGDLKPSIDKLDQMIDVANDFIESLRPETLDTLGLSQSLLLLVQDWERTNSGCRYTATVEINERIIPDAVANAVYRILQEGLTNVFKHSQATDTRVVVKTCTNTQNPCLNLSIIDNGVGFEYNTRSLRGGHGLNSMKERAVSLGGTFNVNVIPKTTTEIAVCIPLKRSV